MRLTVNLEDDLYAIARSLAKTEDCSISEAINRLLRRALEPARPPPSSTDEAFPIVRGAAPFTSEDVYRIDGEGA